MRAFSMYMIRLLINIGAPQVLDKNINIYIYIYAAIDNYANIYIYINVDMTKNIWIFVGNDISKKSRHN